MVATASYGEQKKSPHLRRPACFALEGCPVLRLLARVVLAHFPHLIEHLFEVVACRQLEWREVDVGHEFLLPQELADG